MAPFSEGSGFPPHSYFQPDARLGVGPDRTAAEQAATAAEVYGQVPVDADLRSMADAGATQEALRHAAGQWGHVQVFMPNMSMCSEKLPQLSRVVMPDRSHWWCHRHVIESSVCFSAITQQMCKLS
jgi:hypothetical protein